MVDYLEKEVAFCKKTATFNKRWLFLFSLPRKIYLTTEVATLIEKTLLEIFGYTGSFLVILSMMMTSVSKLRALNVCGAFISAIYSAVYQAYPVVLLNVCLMIINVFQLVRNRANEKRTGLTISAEISTEALEYNAVTEN